MKIEEGVWFVYDGDCPLCHRAAHALAIKEVYGQLHLLNARADAEHPLMREINTRKLDLDEGMVIYCNRRFYHGKEALKFMARYGHPQGWFNRVNRLLFRSETLAASLYPAMRGARNFLLRCLGRSKLDNLGRRARPIFMDVFGDKWETLPPVLKQHYANRPYSTDRISVQGILNVSCHSYMRLFRPFYRILGNVPAVNEDHVPVTVHFDSSEHSNAFHFNRIFYFKTGRPYHFCSRMIPIGKSEVIEIMRFGICWRTRFACTDDKVTLTHRGYALKILNIFLPLPITWLIGRGDAEEIAVDENHFYMKVELKNPLFGVVYSYQGRFEVVKRA